MVVETLEMERIENFVPKFLVVQFDDQNNPVLCNQRAIVPVTCLLEESAQGATVLYAPPPYRKKNLENIQRIVWENEAIPKSWKSIKCQILYKFETIESASFFLQNPVEILDSNMQGTELHHEEIFLLPSGEAATQSQLNQENSEFKFSTKSENGISLQNPIEITLTGANFSNKDEPLGSAATQILTDSVKGLHQSLITWMDKQFKDMDKKLSGINQQLNDQGARITDLSDQVQNLTALLNDDQVLPIPTGDLRGVVDERVDAQGVRINEVPEPLQNFPAMVKNKHNLSMMSSLTIDDMSSLFHCTFPLEELDQFLKFDQNLKTSEILRNSLLEFLRNRIVKKKTICKSMGAILKKFIKRDVLRSYTATKKSGDKLIFCETQFYKLLEGPMRWVFRDKEGNLLDETAVKKSVGSAINNSIDWDGGRCKRMKHSPVDEQAMEHNYNSKCT
ncbi:hypothetical protein QAD02_014910 [Eretmocerus hayati]|uniref:Uncharacterized protein n=1 Tax=Eretmocerus hayati TaxID=131215 RepID=A0ACC2P7P3_9HYME|nr:hypothetical protein QAD02_014910 [Eretmocerus hayati]